MKRYITSNFDSDVSDSWDDDSDNLDYGGDGYDEFDGKKYFIFSEDRGSGIKIETTDNPKTAISAWFRLSRGGDAYVAAKTREDAIALVTAGTPELLTSLWNKYGSKDKLDYLIYVCERQRERGCPSFYESPRFGDQVDPFSLG